MERQHLKQETITLWMIKHYLNEFNRFTKYRIR